MASSHRGGGGEDPVFASLEEREGKQVDQLRSIEERLYCPGFHATVDGSQKPITKQLLCYVENNRCLIVVTWFTI